MYVCLYVYGWIVGLRVFVRGKRGRDGWKGEGKKKGEGE